MRHFALSAIGRDRPGIVAGVTADLLAHAVNVEDSQMSILRGHFTLVLILGAGEEVDAQALRAQLERDRGAPGARRPFAERDRGGGGVRRARR